jgi:uncharacterized membrane protein
MTQVLPQSAEPDHPPLSDVIERNIQNQVRLRLEALSRRTFQERLADAITVFSGNLSFVYLHALWFGLWVLLNTGWFGIRPFDAFPSSLLTMIVSLEAIFLSTFVLISQNRSGVRPTAARMWRCTWGCSPSTRSRGRCRCSTRSRNGWVW